MEISEDRSAKSSELPYKKASGNTDGDGKDPQFIGSKVQLDTYSFALEMKRSKSTDALVHSTDSKKVDQQTAEAHQANAGSVMKSSESQEVHVQSVPPYQASTSKNVGNEGSLESSVVESLEKESIRIFSQTPGSNADPLLQSQVMDPKSKSNEEGARKVPMLKIVGEKAVQAHHVESGTVKSIYKNPSITVQVCPISECTKFVSRNSQENSSHASTLELKVESDFAGKKDFEIHIKSKNSYENLSSSNNYNDAEDKLVGFVDVNTGVGASHRVQYFNISPAVPIKHVTQSSSTTCQTEKETESSSAHTSSVEVPSVNEAFSQTGISHTVFTSKKVTDTEEIETDKVLQNHMTVLKEKETATRSSQTETAAFPSVTYKYDALTQNVVDIATMTDFYIHTADKENSTEKSVGTEDLPVSTLIAAKAEKVVDIEDLPDTPLIIAKAEKAVHTEDLPFRPPVTAKEEKAEPGNKEIDGRSCQYSCGHQKQHDSIYKCCYHRDYGSVTPASLLIGYNLQSPVSSCEASECEHCQAYRETTSKPEEKLKNDVHSLYCYKWVRNEDTKRILKASQDVVDKIKPLKSIQLEPFVFHSITGRDRLNNLSNLVIAKSLESELQKDDFPIAVKVFKAIKVERVTILPIPITFQHFLKSFKLSTLRKPRVVVNPTDIKLAVNQRVASEELQSEQLKRKSKSQLDRGWKDKRKSTRLMFFDGTRKKPLKVSCTSPTGPACDKTNSDICLCSRCYSNVQSAVQKKQNILKEDPDVLHVPGKEKREPLTNQLRSTSPKINHKHFDYTSKDAWKPCIGKNDEFLCTQAEPADITYIDEESFSGEFFEGTEDICLNDACETVNDHLLSLRPVDADVLRKAGETLHRRWFEVAGAKYSDVREVRNYIQYFEEFSHNLVKTLFHSVDNNGNSVLHFAFANNRFDLVEELLQNGYAKELLNKGNKTGNSPLLICSISQPKRDSDWSTVCKAFEMGNVNVKSAKSGQTPLMNAASWGFHSMVDKLLYAGANPNLQDKDGSTALMYAAEHGHEKCVTALVRHKKCDPTIRDKDGQTACSIALNNGQKNIAVLIHMQVLEKRRMSENSYSNKRYVWTNSNNKAARRRALFAMPTSYASDSWDSH